MSSLSARLAAIGALIALAATRYQVEHTRNQNLAAARAVLPLALSAAIGVARKGLLFASGEETGTRLEIEDALELDDRIIDILRDCIRSADPVTREWLQVLIARYQVYYAQIDWWVEEPTPTIVHHKRALSINRQDAVLAWATFHALVEHFYPYARGSEDTVPICLDVERLNNPYNLHLFHVQYEQAFIDRKNARVERLKDGKIEHFQFDR